MAEAMLDAAADGRCGTSACTATTPTLKPVTYYNKLPPEPDIDVALVARPDARHRRVGASRPSTSSRSRGVRRIKFVGLIAAPEGVDALQSRPPGRADLPRRPSTRT